MKRRTFLQSAAALIGLAPVAARAGWLAPVAEPTIIKLGATRTVTLAPIPEGKIMSIARLGTGDFQLVVSNLSRPIMQGETVDFLFKDGEWSEAA